MTPKKLPEKHTRNNPMVTATLQAPDLFLLDELVQTGVAASVSHAIRLAIQESRPALEAKVREAKSRRGPSQ